MIQQGYSKGQIIHAAASVLSADYAESPHFENSKYHAPHRLGCLPQRTIVGCQSLAPFQIVSHCGVIECNALCVKRPVICQHTGGDVGLCNCTVPVCIQQAGV